jgi:hypothetical protein
MPVFASFKESGMRATSRLKLPEMLRGDWRGATRLYAGLASEPEHASAAWLRCSQAGGPGRLRLRYVWSFEGRLREGHLLLAFDPSGRSASGAWMDSGLDTHEVLSLRGMLAEDGLLRLTGTLRPESGTSLQWRIEFDAPETDALELRMYVTSPHGEEELAVSADYRRERRGLDLGPGARAIELDVPGERRGDAYDLPRPRA